MIKVNIQELLQFFETSKVTTFSDAKTWRNSGPEYQSSATSQELGWEKAISALLSYI